MILVDQALQRTICPGYAHRFKYISDQAIIKQAIRKMAEKPYKLPGHLQSNIQALITFSGTGFHNGCGEFFSALRKQRVFTCNQGF
jgi:hypothetical protein